MTPLPGLYYRALADRRAREVRDALSGRYAAVTVVKSATVMNAQQIAVDGQRYDLDSSGLGLAPGATLAVKNIGRLAAAVFAPSDAWGGSSTSTTTTAGGGTATLDDAELVRRDGTHSLEAAAEWEWEEGAEVNGALRSQGNGLLQVMGAVYAGKREGPAAGAFAFEDDAGNASAVIQATDSDGVPVFSAGGQDSGDPDEAWANIGREGYPRIHFESMAGYDRKVPIVDPELIGAGLAGLLDHGDLGGLGDDDHPQYVKDAGDTMSGNLVMGEDAALWLGASAETQFYSQYDMGVPILTWLYSDTLPITVEAGVDLTLSSRTGKVVIDGSEIDASSNLITNVANATADTDALNRQTGDGRYALTGHTHPGGTSTIWQPLTNGDAASPELVFADGDVIMVGVPA